MNYDHFRTAWHEALNTADLLPFAPWPTETIDLGQMGRTYSIIMVLRDMQQAKPFYVTAGLSWQWGALQSARIATTEEDMLIELFGHDGHYYDTEQPWLRIDVTLSATLPLDSPMLRPRTDAWHRWVTNVTARLEPLLPIQSRGEKGGLVAFSWRSDPTAQFQCAPDGRLYLTGVELSAWQRIDLPRQWDDPDREQDPEPDAQLVDFAGRMRDALQVWEDSLRHLQPPAPRQPRNTPRR
ncbi:MAG: hypothetical protein ACE5F6_21070 [Anaerolineae bacterium]